MPDCLNIALTYPKHMSQFADAVRYKFECLGVHNAWILSKLSDGAYGAYHAGGVQRVVDDYRDAAVKYL